MFAVSMVATQLAPKPQREDNVVPVPGLFMAKRLPPYAKNGATPVHALLRWSQLDMH